jgi:cell wall-associated NlpC family hydrolase
VPVKPGYLLLAAGGGVLIWSGLKGKSVSSVFRQLAGGDSPEAAQSSNLPVSGFTPPAILGTGTPTTVGAGALAEAVTLAVSFVGKAPYVYGGTSPTGWDCSGMVQYIYSKLGINLPRTSEEQWAAVQHIDASQLAPGDLVFAQFVGDNASPGHVGIYVGNGQIVSAEDQQLGTGYSSLASWGSAIVGYGTP